MLSGTVLSPWLVLPLGGLMLLIIAGHISATEERTTPPSRRRIRVANGWVMLMLVPLLSAGFGVVSPAAHPRAFALVWLATISLLFVVLTLALMDIANTIRLTIRARRRLQDTAHRLGAEALRLQGEALEHESGRGG